MLKAFKHNKSEWIRKFLAKTGTFHVIAYFLWIPLGILMCFSRVCGGGYDQNLGCLCLMILSWLACAKWDQALWKSLDVSEPADLLGFPQNSYLKTFPILMISIGTLSEPEYYPYYVLSAVLMGLIVRIYYRTGDIKILQFKWKRFLLSLFCLFLYISGLIFEMISLSITGAINCSKSSSVKANMHTLQTNIMHYASENHNQCPADLKPLIKKPYWKKFSNPYHPRWPAIVESQKLPPNPFPPFIDILGIRLVFHHDHAGAVLYQWKSTRDCQIYGIDLSGQIMLDKGKPFSLEAITTLKEYSIGP